MDSLVADKAHGNPEVVSFMEKALHRTRQGDVGYAAVALGLTSPQGEGCGINYSGDLRLEPAVIKGLKELTAKLETSVDSWQLPIVDETLDESYATYNGVLGPLGFDYINWLADAYMTKVKAGISDPLKVGIWRGKLGLGGDDRGHIWADNVFSPITALQNDTVESKTFTGRHNMFYSLRGVTNMYKEGIPLPTYSLPEDYKPFKELEKGKYITITLRETTRFQWRNSNVPVWAKFARWLMDKKGQQVIIVRDTMKADIPLAEFDICPQASKNIFDRFYLYENAKCNIAVGNGPLELCWLTDIPYINFQNSGDDNPSHEISQTATGFEFCHGFKAGGQFPWAKENQILVWREPTFNNLTRSWDDYGAK
jgi:hypothetical protein